MAFNFTPSTGLLDTNTYPANPESETAARQQFMDLFGQIKDYLNGLNNTKSLSPNGYIKLTNPSGTDLILQWGTVTYSSATGFTGMYSVFATFPVTFPNALVYFNAFESLNNYDEQKFSHVSIQNSEEGFLDKQTVKWYTSSPGAWTFRFRWFAIGY